MGLMAKQTLDYVIRKNPNAAYDFTETLHLDDADNHLFELHRQVRQAAGGTKRVHDYVLDQVHDFFRFYRRMGEIPSYVDIAAERPDFVAEFQDRTARLAIHLSAIPRTDAKRNTVLHKLCDDLLGWELSVLANKLCGGDAAALLKLTASATTTTLVPPHTDAADHWAFFWKRWKPFPAKHSFLFRELDQLLFFADDEYDSQRLQTERWNKSLSSHIRIMMLPIVGMRVENLRAALAE